MYPHSASKIRNKGLYNPSMHTIFITDIAYTNTVEYLVQ